MSQTVEMHIIARIRSDFPTKFGIPRQSGLADCTGALYSSRNTANCGCAARHRGFSHLWLIWQFFPPRCARAGRRPCARPKLGGNKAHRRVCDTLAVPPERDRTVLGAA